MQFECRKCGQGWGGYNTCHCAAKGCCNTFTSLSAFDKHRAGSHAKGRYCLDPVTAVEENPESPRYGEKLFQLSSRPYPCWGLAGEKPEYWKES